MIFLSTIRSAVATFFICALLPVSASAQADASLTNSTTLTGKCNPNEMSKFSAEVSGSTFSTAPAIVYEASGLSPAETELTIPAMTGLRCHYRDRDKILVSDDTNGYCGWIDDDKILQGKQSSSGLTGEKVCGVVAPLLIRDFCKRSEEVAGKGATPKECYLDWINTSPFETKLLIWNADTSAGSDNVQTIEVPTYRSADSDERFQTVKIFNVLRVYDIKRSKQGVRYLVGASHRRMEGWIDASYGAIWYSKLATFFSAKGEFRVLLDEPGSDRARPLAERPPNIDKMLTGAREFRRYPVLVDNRESRPEDPPGKKPHLQVAFIGANCEGEGAKGGLCSDVADNPITLPVEILQRADILFLLDATKSMSPYFGLVSRAVKEVAQEYVGTPDYQFGVSFYGDHVTPGQIGLDDPMDYRSVIDLAPLFDGDEFDGLKGERLYITDAQKDLPEAMYAALARAIQSTPWRGQEPRFIIHIADHGDRDVPPARLLDLMRKNKIFYLPVAVRGSYDQKANPDFVAQTRAIINRHQTPKGTPIGTETLVTYSGSTPVSPAEEYAAIVSGLKGAVEFGKQQREFILNELFERKDGPSTGSIFSQYPPGYAKMLEAAREIYGIDVKKLDQKALPVAARGYIETALPGQAEPNWSYYAEIRPQNLRELQRSFESLCGNILAPDAEQDLVKAVSKVVEILTGDILETSAEFQKYFKDRDKIPLSKLTILGDGLLRLADDLTSTTESGISRVKGYQREVCRSAILLSLMQSSQRVNKPNEGGDLAWDEKRARVTYTNASQFDWVFKDDFGETSIFLPLSYLPGAAQAR